MEDAKVANEEAMQSDSSSIVNVAGVDLTAQDLADYLRRSFRLDVIYDLIKFTLIEAEASNRSIEASEEEVNNKITEIRLERQLLTVEATEKWLHGQRLTMDEFWEIAERLVRVEKLSQQIVDDEAINEHFAMKKTALARVGYYQILVSEENKAIELSAQLRLKTSFFDLARQYSEDEATRKSCGYAGIRLLSELDSEIQFKIMGAREGDIIGPVKSHGQYYLILIDRLLPAVLDDETREVLRTQLFQKWCSDYFNSTPIRWLIGDSEE
jgi:parvulin-like peptidyl-prolyl isomerase